ncbi:hypothetical protein BHU72_09860 [Desulfuribacillus stibiiarsenatis]|uniref:HTH marR-type domain-containing protein n=1 Tax=Desulfuribacillus stibiiarsenatis TaxID=1390249 RepID=A0A1E5L349_9FIRM|nr:MarR family transcriptional regulator [Desulfuribacillus stibiiarsenatis]OEH84501.1 hypothetical protein BHU72_09860 [Desulfuribacillus stibiiarsenatis]
MDQHKIIDSCDRLETAMLESMRILSKITDQLEPGLTGEQFYLLRMIHKKQRTTSTQLANIFGVKPSAITVMVERLYNQGFICRDRDESDRRVIFLHLSEKGKQVVMQCEEKRLEMITTFLSELEDGELESLVRVSEKLATIIKKHQEE